MTEGKNSRGGKSRGGSSSEAATPTTEGAVAPENAPADALLRERTRQPLDRTAVVAVVDICPARRHGVAAAVVDAGFSVEAPTALAGWFRHPGNRLAVISISHPQELSTVRQLSCEIAEPRIVVLLPMASPAACREALQAGASAVISQDAELEEIVEVIRGTARGHTILPRFIAQAILRDTSAPQLPPSLTEDDLELLRALAAGTKVRQLADQYGYSERAIYRRLASLYRRLGASNRAQALLAAVRHGLIT